MNEPKSVADEVLEQVNPMGNIRQILALPDLLHALHVSRKYIAKQSCHLDRDDFSCQKCIVLTAIENAFIKAGGI